MPYSLITRDDFDSLRLKLRTYGWKYFKNRMRPGNRVSAWWDSYQVTGSDWWDIPMVRERWNSKISGEKQTGYETYFVQKYLGGKSNLSLLSVGCGTGSKERIFAEFPNFSSLEGYDVSEKALYQARKKAEELRISHLHYQQLNFEKDPVPDQQFDVILFNASLHHFCDIPGLIRKKILPILHRDGYLIMFEYAGANRFQYPDDQLDAVNRCLQLIPEKYRITADGRIKKKVYRPGLLRMWLSDPSESPASETILPALRNNLRVMEEKPVGGSVLHPLLKGIAHNFADINNETEHLLNRLFEEDDKYYSETGWSDFWFGVYAQK